MEVRHIRYNRQTAYVREHELAGNAFVIRPPYPLGISRTEDDPAELRRVYDIGRAEMERLLPDLKEFLAAGR
jgi:predicted patatin/cPLA2 family phospholipase